MMQRISNLAFAAASLLLAAVAIVVLATQPPRQARAQFSDQSTWIPAANIGGGANTITLNIPNIIQLSDILGVKFRFLPANINAAGGATINPSSLGPVSVLRPSAGSAGVTLVPVAGGDLSTSVVAEILYDGTEFILTNPATGTAPVGSEVMMSGGSSTAAMAGYLIENGTCISTTTYSALFSVYGNADIWSPGSTGGACAGGQFHLAFANGTVVAAVDGQGSVTAGKLTNAVSGCSNGSASLCGAQQRTLAQANLGSWSFPVTGTLTNTGVNSLQFFICGTGFSSCTGGSAQAAQYVTTSQASGATIVNGGAGIPNVTISPGNVTAASNGSGTPVVTVQPTRTVLVQVKY